MTAESRFTTCNLPERRRFDAWRESIAVLYDVKLGKNEPEDAFYGEVHGFLYQDMMIARCRTSAQVYRRSALKIARDGVDHYMIQYFRSGEQWIRRGKRYYESTAGDIMVHDLASDHVAESSAFDNFSLILPRRLIEPLLRKPDHQHGRILRDNNPMARMLARHMADLYELNSQMDDEQRGLMNDVTTQMVAATLNGSREDAAENAASMATSTLLRAKRLLEAEIDDPVIDVGRIANAAGVSRASLYRLFEPYGGVMHYVRRRRLLACLKDLTDGDLAHRTIADIAYSHGFSSETHFSRLFKKHFGVTPSEARHHGCDIVDVDDAVLAETAVGDRHYEKWISETLL